MFSFVSAQESTDLSGDLEIFSWWAGDEGPALEALIALYNSLYPNVNVINATVTGGSGVNARAVLSNRMLGGNPPSSFQVHAGDELTDTWVVAQRMEDLTFLYEEEGWFDAFPQGILDLMIYEGGIYSVPVNIHRSNVMWFNPDKLAEWGISAPATWDEFLAVCPTIQEAGVVPLIVGEEWTQRHLWESVALAVLGADGWNGFWAGTTAPDSPEMVAVWEKFGQILACTNIDVDAAGLSWQQAIDKVVAGEAAFNIMGDWAAGYMATTLELEPGVGFGYAPSPDTAGTFLALSDSFGLPLNAPNRDAAVAWLRVLGSVDGQNAFNPLKGSIPARSDIDLEASGLYNSYLVATAADWASNVIAGSLVHGTVGNPRFASEFSTVLDIFKSTRDAGATSSALLAICIQSGECGY
ncbi:MAG: ABC transporter substrate-binding protein [Anaerolineae bacterium]|nr:ABC transporter substrate-binding protein [Anaerolineae bacterium]